MLNIQKTKIMASGPITSWQTEGENSKISFKFYVTESWNVRAGRGFRVIGPSSLFIDEEKKAQRSGQIRDKDPGIQTSAQLPT